MINLKYKKGAFFVANSHLSPDRAVSVRFASDICRWLALPAQWADVVKPATEDAEVG
jgi:hypothetical protein